jgi:hypothetical protein
MSAKGLYAIHPDASSLIGAATDATNRPISLRRVLPWCFRENWPFRVPFAKSLKSGAPDKIRTCDLCLRRVGDAITAIE